MTNQWTPICYALAALLAMVIGCRSLGKHDDSGFAMTAAEDLIIAKSLRLMRETVVDALKITEAPSITESDVCTIRIALRDVVKGLGKAAEFMERSR